MREASSLTRYQPDSSVHVFSCLFLSSSIPFPLLYFFYSKYVQNFQIQNLLKFPFHGSNMIKYDQIGHMWRSLPKCCSQSLCSEISEVRAIVGRDPVGDPVLQITRNAAAVKPGSNHCRAQEIRYKKHSILKQKTNHVTRMRLDNIWPYDIICDIICVLKTINQGD